jgi:hypothetical protein
VGIVISLIPGLMFGIEFLWDEGILVLDVGIIRFMIGSINE